MIRPASLLVLSALVLTAGAQDAAKFELGELTIAQPQEAMASGRLVEATSYWKRGQRALTIAPPTAGATRVRRYSHLAAPL